jgi:adenylate cyclase
MGGLCEQNDMMPDVRLPPTARCPMHEQTNPPKLRLHHGPIEIERKFLVANDEWRRSAVRSVNIRDGLIAASAGRKVRVRVSGDMATIVVKGPRSGIVRPEFEYEIPLADAQRMLATACGDDTLEKQRFFVEDAGATWHVDIYCGLLQGVVLAEVELKDATQELIIPDWVGTEVTGDPFYRKVNMRARALQLASAGAASIQSSPSG